MEELFSSKDPFYRLTEAGLLSRDQLQIGLTESKRSGDSLDKSLLRLGFVTDSLLVQADETHQRGMSRQGERINLPEVLPDPDALALIPADVARCHQLVPVSLRDKRLLVAVADLYDLPAQDKVRSLLDAADSPTFTVASAPEIASAIDRFYGFELSIDGILHEIETGEINHNILISDDDYHQPVVRLVDAILIDAVKSDASDIHFEPEAGFIRIRYRVDGVMRQIRSFHIDYWAAIVVRVKVLAELNIAESRAPQDGQLSMNVSGRSIEFRVSCMPTVHGENIVLRILDRQKGIVPLDKLGLHNHTLKKLTDSMERPEGLILITGPTGSGKTTTLYSMLAHKSDERINIMTLEDPVEYPMAMLRQTTVNEQVKLDFSSGIKSILRQDPDVILVGEIRDGEVAEMVFRASMTGHQVYSTLHANSAAGAIARLKDIGVTPSIISDSVISIVGQRLVRKLCLNCRVTASEPTDEGQCFTHKPGGCDSCNSQGYRGRIAVIEVLRFNDVIRDLVVSDANVSAISEYATQQGYSNLPMEAMKLVYAGVTSITEVSRVIDIPV